MGVGCRVSPDCSCLRLLPTVWRLSLLRCESPCLRRSGKLESPGSLDLYSSSSSSSSRISCSVSLLEYSENSTFSSKLSLFRMLLLLPDLFSSCRDALPRSGRSLRSLCDSRKESSMEWMASRE